MIPNLSNSDSSVSADSRMKRKVGEMLNMYRDLISALLGKRRWNMIVATLQKYRKKKTESLKKIETLQRQHY